jgi:hypothetical protein
VSSEARLAGLDAVELGEMLDFLGDFFASAPQGVADAFARFTVDAYPVAELRADLARFARLLGDAGDEAVSR